MHGASQRLERSQRTRSRGSRGEHRSIRAPRWLDPGEASRVRFVSVRERDSPRSRCSTPTSSDSVAEISDMMCLKVHVSCFPSRISSTAWYASVGMPSCFGLTSMMTITGLGVYRRTS
eukprot:4763718-Prymnesium_polylepis.1